MKMIQTEMLTESWRKSETNEKKGNVMICWVEINSVEYLSSLSQKEHIPLIVSKQPNRLESVII